MSKNYAKETALIGVNDSVCEKMMALALYKELSSSLVRYGQENGCEDWIKEKYLPMMESELKNIVTSFTFYEHERVNALEFMRFYLLALRENILSNYPQVNHFIIDFENNLEEHIINNECAKILDKYPEISYTTRANIMDQFQNYINNVNQAMIKYCGKENTQGLYRGVLDVLLSKLDTFLLECSNGNNDFDLLTVLKTTTKNYLLEKLDKCEFGIDMIEDEITKKLLEEFDDNKKKIWIVGLIYGISDIDISKEQIKEICQLLDISKLMYFKTVFQMGISVDRLVKKELSDQNLVLRKNRKKK